MACVYFYIVPLDEICKRTHECCFASTRRSKQDRRPGMVLLDGLTVRFELVNALVHSHGVDKHSPKPLRYRRFIHSPSVAPISHVLRGTIAVLTGPRSLAIGEGLFTTPYSQQSSECL